MKNLNASVCLGCVALALGSGAPALGNSDAIPGGSSEYIVTRSSSASGWTTVTLTPLKVECERILRSVKMDIFALGGTGPHPHQPAKITCDDRDGHFSVKVDLGGDAIGKRAVNDAALHHQSIVYVPAQDDQTVHGPADGHSDHQHVVHVFHDLE